jgi:beta-lactam-binding protein with PASTA domain
MDPDEFEKMLEQLRQKRETKVAPDQIGRVLDQKPAAGTTVMPGSSVSLVIGVR